MSERKSVFRGGMSVADVAEACARLGATTVNETAKRLDRLEWHNHPQDTHEGGVINPRKPDTPSTPKSAGDTLAHGDRMDEYGHPKVSFDRIADMWSAYLSAPEVDPENLTAEDVGHLMMLLKISRSITDKKPDTLDDIEGYVSCVRMVRSVE